MKGIRCEGENARGERCRAFASPGEAFCFFHDPARADEAAEARRTGGVRRRRERVVTAAYELGDLTTTDGLFRLLQVAVTDILQLENSIARGRSLLYAISVGTRLAEVRDVEARLQAIESAIASKVTPFRGARG